MRRISRRPLALCASLLALGVLAVGCGSSDDSTTTDGGVDGGGVTTSSLSKAEMIEQADEICEEANEALAEDADEFAKENDVDTTNPTEAQRQAVIVEVVVPNLREQAQKIEELGAPEGDEAEVEAVLDSLRKGADELEDQPMRLREAGGGPLKGTAELAKSYGFEVCGAG